jgi:hypothetical protein
MFFFLYNALIMKIIMHNIGLNGSDNRLRTAKVGNFLCANTGNNLLDFCIKKLKRYSCLPLP